MGLLPETARVTGSIKLHGDELLGKGDNEHVAAAWPRAWRWCSRTRCRR